MKRLCSTIIPALSLGYCLSAQAQVSPSVTLPWDTAFIEPQTYIDNKADTIAVSGRQFTGPGPYTVHFQAAVDDQTTYFAWQIAADNSFQIIDIQYYDLEVDYEFRDAGTYYARFITSNADNTSETFSEPYVIQITESLLEIPNVITPDSPSGSNRIFKVKYKSLVRFELWVFNRWGNKLFHTTDPSEGWDGSYNGRIVPTGAYYYLVKAEGTDGIRYERKGDINVLRVRKTGEGNSFD